MDFKKIGMAILYGFIGAVILNKFGSKIPVIGPLIS